VEVIDARLGRESASTGEVRVVIRLRVTNRANEPRALDPPVLYSGNEEGDARHHRAGSGSCAA